MSFWPVPWQRTTLVLTLGKMLSMLEGAIRPQARGLVNCGGRNLDKAVRSHILARSWEEVLSVSTVSNTGFRGHGRRKEVTKIADKQEVGKGQDKFL